jgi:hypothetical protein
LSIGSRHRFQVTPPAGSRSVAGGSELETVVSESFTAQLEHKLKKAPPKRKGDRTRERLKLGAARVLENVGYHALRIVDITEAAETSDGSFYIYFKDKKDITLCVLQEFLENMQQGELTSQEPPHSLSIDQGIKSWLAGHCSLECRAHALCPATGR